MILTARFPRDISKKILGWGQRSAVDHIWNSVKDSNEKQSNLFCLWAECGSIQVILSAVGMVSYLSVPGNYAPIKSFVAIGAGETRDIARFKYHVFTSALSPAGNVSQLPTRI